jgi:NAD(P)-dependent dehydrogenase (short-subunit alcohol dehydrogenase family)
VCHLDLAELPSVRKFADSVKSVDVLVNNAGVLGLPLTRTTDGFEAHMGINYLGHFALTCLLGDKIKDRAVSVSSVAYVFGRIHLDDLNWHTREYSMWAAYAESKLAIMLFVNELARRGIRAYACDPGGADTNIARYSTGVLRWSAEHRAAVPGAERCQRGAGQHPGGHDGAAQRNLSRAQIQISWQAQGDNTT